MPVPVISWGSMGNFATEQQEFAAQAADYMEANEVYDLFAHLLRQVTVNQPDNHIAFLQDLLRGRPPLTVCVLGPPGINRTKYCQNLEQTFNIKHIHVGKLLRQKKELKEQIEAGTLVEDSIVNQIVQVEIAKAAKTGWVLDGFPRTKPQAMSLALKGTGTTLDKVILLHTGESVIRQRFAAKVAAAGLDPATREDFINTRLEQYQRHVVSIAEFFKNVVRQVEVSGDDASFETSMALVRRSLHYRPYSNAPFRSHRICVVGAPGSGRTTQCRALAKHFGLVHVDVSVLARKLQRERGTLVDGGIPPEWMSDEDLCSIVGSRLNEIDCLRKGWVLDGFPKTVNQAEFLRESHQWPTRIISLNVSEEFVLERSATRQVDPTNGAAYYKPPQNPVVAGRLISADYDEPNKVRERYQLHQGNIGNVLLIFPVVRSAVSGEDPANEVTGVMVQKVDEPLPTELAQDPTGSAEG